MFNTEFTYVNNTYRLVVDSTLAVKTAAWLEQQGVVFDRYFKHEGFCKFIFISAPDKAIALITAKYPLPTEPIVATPDTGSAPEYKFVVRGDMPKLDMIYNCYWVECESPELAQCLALELEESIDTYWNIVAEGCRVHFQDPDFEDDMVLLYYQLVARFRSPVNQDELRVLKMNSGTLPYYFDDCHTPESIKAKYRQLSKLHHPDCGGDSETFTAND
jgi:hypothetical protein